MKVFCICIPAWTIVKISTPWLCRREGFLWKNTRRGCRYVTSCMQTLVSLTILRAAYCNISPLDIHNFFFTDVCQNVWSNLQSAYRDCSICLVGERCQCKAKDYLPYPGHFHRERETQKWIWSLPPLGNSTYQRGDRYNYWITRALQKFVSNLFCGMWKFGISWANRNLTSVVFVTMRPKQGHYSLIIKLLYSFPASALYLLPPDLRSPYHPQLLAAQIFRFAWDFSSSWKLALNWPIWYLVPVYFFSHQWDGK